MQGKQSKQFLLVAALFCIACGLVHPVTPTLLQMRGMGDWLYGVSMGAAMSLSFLFSPFVGRLNAVVSSRRVLLVCCLGYAAAQTGFSLAQSTAAVLFFRVIGGGLGGFGNLCLLTYVANRCTTEQRGKYLAIVATMLSVGSAAGYLLGGLLGQGSIFWAFWAQAALLLCCGVLGFLWFANDAVAPVARQAANQARDALRKRRNPFSAFSYCRAMLNGPQLLLLCAIALSFFGNTVFDVNFNYYIRDQLDLGPAYNGAFKAASGLITLLVNSTLCLWLMRKRDGGRSLAVLTLGCAVCTLGVVFSGGALFFGCNIVYLAFSASTWPMMQEQVASMAPEGESGVLLGLYSSLQSLGIVLGSMLAGVLYLAGAKIPFVVGMIAFFAAAGGMLLFVRLTRGRKVTQK